MNNKIFQWEKDHFISVENNDFSSISFINVQYHKGISKTPPMLYYSKKQCCGCSGCFSICPKHAITMTDDMEGFKYPVIDYGKCISCLLCQKVCPIDKSE